MWRNLSKYQPKPAWTSARQLKILLDHNVCHYIAAEVRKYPTVEEGGKYIGYLCKPGHPNFAKLGIGPKFNALVITDFLPSGPKAVRTTVEFIPDGEYQESLFRRIEQKNGAIEHLGTWHTHHCNGLRTLSSGDVDGYFRTVNKANYRPKYFLASLVKSIPSDPESSGWIDHFLFIRGIEEYYLVTDRVEFIDCPTDFGADTGHLNQPQGIANSTSRSNTVDVLQTHLTSKWYETAEGRSVLAEDRRFFHEHFAGKVTATRHDSQITVTGTTDDKAVSVIYPRASGEKDMSISLQQNDICVLRIHCNLSFRRISFRAALAAVQAL
jgi:hypothetical protein